MNSINERIQSLVPEFMKSMIKKGTQVICGRNSFEGNVSNVRKHFRKAWNVTVVKSAPRGTYTPNQIHEFSNAPAIQRAVENFITKTDFLERVFEAQVKLGMDRVREDFSGNYCRNMMETQTIIHHYMSSSKPSSVELKAIALEVSKRLCKEHFLGSSSLKGSSRTQIEARIREEGILNFGLGRYVEDIIPDLTQKVMGVLHETKVAPSSSRTGINDSETISETTCSIAELEKMVEEKDPEFLIFTRGKKEFGANFEISPSDLIFKDWGVKVLCGEDILAFLNDDGKVRVSLLNPIGCVNFD